MASALQTSIQLYGQQTTVELARNSTQPLARLAGVKRTYLDYQGDEGAARATASDRQLCNRDAALLPPNRLTASRITLESKKNPDRIGAAASEYSQRKAVQSTPGPTQNPLLSLAHPRYGLPPSLVSNLTSLGIHAIYPWQSSCLLGKGLLNGEANLIYTAPTGGGKSLIADVLLLKKIIECPTAKGILVLPYVALVQEKLKWLRKAVENVSKNLQGLEDLMNAQDFRMKWQQTSKSIRVGGFFGGSIAKATWADIDIAVCTIEKANSLVNTAIEEGKIDQLGIVVLDELHMLDDENRGYIMELLITKLLCLEHGIQLVGMSATLSNPQLMAEWLKAKFYVSKYRPVPIEESLVYENAIYPTTNAKDFYRTAGQLNSTSATPKTPSPTRLIDKSIHRELENPVANAVIALSVETAANGYGALVFCSSRQGSQKTAILISEALPAGDVGRDVLDKRMEILAALQALPGGFDPALSKTVLRGVGFHHAGLTVEEREVVAEAYDNGNLKVMVATCSLAAGINLPARRVILNGARMGRDLVGPAMLRQMRGRAGRKGKDEVGETYLCCQKVDLEAVADLLEAEVPPVESCLMPEKRGVKRAVLEVIATRLATTRESLNDYIQHSLLWHTTSHTDVLATVDAAVQSLLDTELITHTELNALQPTELGQAIVAASLTPEDGISVHNDMRRALESFVMDGEMHIFYLFTPIQTFALSDVNWPIFRDQLESLDESGVRALRCVGVNPAFVNKLVNSGAELKGNTEEEVNLRRIYRRAYSAFQLRDLCNEVPVNTISLKYAVSRGLVQTLTQTCHGFAAGMVRFCERMGWGMLAAVLDHMVDRLRAGARSDLLEMAQVTYVKSRMARVLWENGFKSVRALAEAEPRDLITVMMQAQARKTRLEDGAAEKLRARLMEKAEIIVSSANRLWEKQQLVELDE